MRKSNFNNLGSLVVCVRCCSLYAVECPSLSRKHGRGHWLISTQVLAAPADGPAALAGVRGTSRSPDGALTLGDVIVDVDGRSINGEADLFKALDRSGRLRREGDGRAGPARVRRRRALLPVTARVPVDIVLGAADDVASVPPLSGRQRTPPIKRDF